MRKSPDVITRTLSGRTLLLPLRPGPDGLWVYDLNSTAAFLWKRIGETDACSPSVDDLVSAVCGEFDIAPETARADVVEFLNDLKQLEALL